ncbi:MAG: PCRF domain-containing protein [Saprospiraceae bacterium]|nr:PCRF domain-containing protein [Saprospiraceae bacterium]
MNLKVELLDSVDGQAKIQVSGKDAGKAFQHEPGKHVVQRVPPTETKGRRQTSTVSVAVLPIQKELDIQLNDNDLFIEPVNLFSKGGQHANRTLSGCRMTHIPTGLQTTINGRDFHANQRKARQILEMKVNEHENEKIQNAHGKNRKAQMGGGSRSGKTRTYNYLNDRVVDHNLGTKLNNVKAIMEKGQFEKLFK